MSEFKRFNSIVRFDSPVTITEKIHGTNAQILIEPVTEWSSGETPNESGLIPLNARNLVRVFAGSRERWLTPDDDNYGFAKWVEMNAAELIEKLGPGRHYGEWYGQGINSGYGLTEKRLALFNPYFFWRKDEASGELVEFPQPNRVDVVPILYQGPYTETCVREAMERLKLSGSLLAPGFMRPEGVVVRFERNGAMFKKVFEAEETAWKAAKTDHTKPKTNSEIVQAKLQPVRLEKLLSKDERYLRGLPETLPALVKAYYDDLSAEGELTGISKQDDKAIKGALFGWVKLMLAERGVGL